MLKSHKGKNLTNEDIERIVDETTQELLAYLTALTIEKEEQPC